MSSEDDDAVDIDGCMLSVVKKPPRDCKAVAEKRKDVLGQVDLDDFLDDLVTVGKFIRTAYNGVVGHADLQIKMRNIGFDIAKLCDESGSTISQFRTTSNRILTNMVGAYKFFLDGFEDMAIASLKSVGEAAGKMAKAADDLSKRFDEEAKKVLEACNETDWKKDLKEKERVYLEKQSKKLQADADRQKEEQALAAREEEILLKEIEASQIKDGKLTAALAPHAYDVALGLVTAGVFPTLRIAAVAISKALESEKLERLRQQRLAKVEMKQKALDEMAKCLKQIVDCQSDELSVSKQAVQALHGAVTALQHLAAIMRNAVTFWEQLRRTCQDEADGNLTTLLDIARQKEDPEVRFQMYRSDHIKTTAVEMYVSWVALAVICDEYTDKVKASRKELYSYICENPKVEEARERNERLLKEFDEHIIRQNANAERRKRQIEAEKK